MPKTETTSTYFFVARDGEAGDGDLHLWKVVDGNVNGCTIVLSERNTDPAVWEAATEALCREF